MEILLILGGVVVVCGGAIWYTMHLKKRRTEACSNESANLGLEFSETDELLFDRIAAFGLASKGRGKEIRNVLSGDAGDIRISIFDYQFITGSGKNQAVHLQTVVLLESQAIRAPSFSMRTQGIFDRVGKAMGYQDIDFDSHPQFSKMFVLQGPNEEAVRKFFNAELLEFFEAKPKVSVEGQSGKLIIYRRNKRLHPSDFKTWLAAAYDVYGRIVDSKE